MQELAVCWYSLKHTAALRVHPIILLHLCITSDSRLRPRQGGGRQWRQRHRDRRQCGRRRQWQCGRCDCEYGAEHCGGHLQPCGGDRRRGRKFGHTGQCGNRKPGANGGAGGVAAAGATATNNTGNAHAVGDAHSPRSLQAMRSSCRRWRWRSPCAYARLTLTDPRKGACPI
jgi:hypothetical protein